MGSEAWFPMRLCLMQIFPLASMFVVPLLGGSSDA